MCLAVVNFHLANFYPKIRSTIVASINGSCQAGVIQLGIHELPPTVDSRTRVLISSSRIPKQSLIMTKLYIVFLFQLKTIFYGYAVFSSIIWINTFVILPKQRVEVKAWYSADRSSSSNTIRKKLGNGGLLIPDEVYP